MIQEKITIINKTGLHARAASKLVAVASRFQSSVRLGTEKMVDGKSILSLMMLAATKGTELNLAIDGDDENEAFTAISELVNNYFEEGE